MLKKSPYYISTKSFYTLMILAVAITLFQSWVTARELPLKVIATNIIFILGSYIYAAYREKSGKVNMEISHEEL